MWNVLGGGGRGAYRVLVGWPDGKNHLENLSVDGRMILKWIFKKREGEGGLIWLRIGPSGGRL